MTPRDPTERMKRVGELAGGFLMGVAAIWLLFGDPPTIALLAIIVVTGAVLLGPTRRRRKQALKNRDET